MNSTCTGLDEGDYCNKNEDCANLLFCKTLSAWPYRSQCTKWLGINDVCIKDTDCEPKLFCWYASVADVSASTKKCIGKYTADTGTEFGWKAKPNLSLIESDEEYNGLHC